MIEKIIIEFKRLTILFLVNKMVSNGALRDFNKVRFLGVFEVSSVMMVSILFVLPFLAISTFVIAADSNNGETSQLKLQDNQSVTFLRNMAGSKTLALNFGYGNSPSDIHVPILIDEAVGFALENNYEVQAANMKLDGAHWDAMGNYAEYLPTVEMNAGVGPERSRPAAINNVNGDRVLDSIHPRRDGSVLIRQPLIDLSLIAGIFSGKKKEDIADSDRIDAREGIAYDTVSVYLSLLQSGLSVRLADDYKKYLDDLAVRMAARVEGGGGTNVDLDRINSRSTMADSARVEALGDFQTNLAEFKRLTNVIPTELVIPETLIFPTPDSAQDAFEQAKKSNPSYLSSLKKIDLASDDRNKSLYGLVPKLSFQYSYTSSYDAGGSAFGNPVDGIWPRQTSQMVMLNAQWNLNATAVTGGYSGEAKVKEMNLRALDLCSHIEQGILAGYTAMNAAHRKQTILQKNLEANTRVVTGFDEQFKNGTRSLFDLLDAYEQLYNSRLNLMRVTIANAKASYQISRLMGELVPSLIIAREK